MAEYIHQCKEVIRKGYGESWRKELEIVGGYMRRNVWTPWHTICEFSLQILKLTTCKAEDLSADMLQLNRKQQRPHIADQISRGINQHKSGWTVWMDTHTGK